MTEQTLKPGWKIYRFDQMATNLVERVDPGGTALDRYVGLEHLDSETLKIQRWGTPGDVIGEKLHFCPRDIIFGKRRAYQRKLAVADFEGICSAHAMVLRAKQEVVLRDFFPFFMQSDLFMNRALEISVGSLSPTINWHTLAEQEFPLPPLHEQRRIAQLLWAINKTKKEYEDLVLSIQTLIVTYRKQFFEGSKNWEKDELGKLYEIKLGKMLSPKSRQGISPRPYMSNINIQWGRIDLSEVKEMDFDDKEFEKNRLRYGDLLVCEGGEVGRSAIWRDELPECGYQKAIHRLRPRSDVLKPELLLQFMFFAAQHGIFAKFTGQSTIAHLPAERLNLVEIPVPPEDKQLEFLNFLDGMQNSLLVAKKRFSQTKSFLSSVINKEVEGA